MRKERDSMIRMFLRIFERENTMRTTRFLCLIFFISLLLLVHAADAPAQTPPGAYPKVQQKVSKFNCSVDKTGIAVCQRLAPAGKFEGQSGVYTQKFAKGKPCRWKCKMEQGVEICRGSGSECNGKIPPHWQ